MTAPLPADEAERLLALGRYEILDTPPEAAFDRVTRLAARLFGVPAAQISFVDHDRRWLKSRFGTDADDSPRELTFCAHAILGGQVLVVPDAALDPRFCCNPCVAAEPGIRFYAGAPLKGRGGHNVGTLCLLDSKPRAFSEEQAATLSDLAAIVVDEMELRLAGRLLREEAAGRERREAEAASSLARTRSIIEAAHDAFVGMDAAGRITDWNRRAEETFGWARDEAIGRLLAQTIIPDRYRQAHIQGLSKYLQTGQGPVLNTTIELSALHRDGREFPIELSISPVHLEQGQVFTAFVRDISERHRATQAMWESEQRLAAFLRYVPGVAFMKDAQGRYAYVNESFEKLVGLTLEHLRGKTDAEIWPPEIAAQFRANDAEVMARKQAVQVVETVPQADGPHFWLSSKFPILDGAGQPTMLAAVSIDITERQRAEHELKAFAVRLERSNRELQDFSYVASHDLQEPLRKIRAFGDRLASKHGGALDASGREYVRFMQEAAARMQTLLEDLLSYSRVTTQASPFSPVDLAEVARQVLEDLELRVEQTGGQVELGALPVIQADHTQMRQLLQNLIGNALKFHRTAVPPLVQVQAQVRGESGHDETCEIVVRDNGIGFEEKYLDRIFQPFQRLHGRESFEGTGIGLAICRKIAERHGGSITARSQPGHGTTFRVSLPLKQATKATAAATSDAATSREPSAL